MKAKFNSEPQDTLDKVPSDVLVMLGDFNARVGVLKSDKEEWQGVVGKHGVDERNEAGEEFLQFCALIQLTMMNTWFQKNIYCGTWMHPATKLFHMIDLVAMRAKQKFYCRDVLVMRGATCWIDHKLVQTKQRIDLPKMHHGEKRMLPFAVHKLVSTAARDEYRCHLESLMQDHPYNPDLPLRKTGIL